MNLDQAIKKIINDYGVDILKERRLVSLLSDHQAFGQLPYAANMLRQIYANGYGTKIHKLYCNKDMTEVAAFQSELRNKLGFDVEMLGKVLYAFSLPVQKGQKQKQQKQNQQTTSNTNKSNLEIVTFDEQTAYRDEFGGIYSYPNCETFYKLDNPHIQVYSVRPGTKQLREQAFCKYEYDGAGLYMGNIMEIQIISLPDTITFIPDRCCCECKKLLQINIPKSVMWIGNHAFADCESLQQVTISDSVKTIGIGVFLGCLYLQQITIPESVISIGEIVFNGCRNLDLINNSNRYIITDKLLIDIIKNRIISYYGEEKKLNIPDSVTSIGRWAFARCKSFQQITIPDSVKDIGEYAFEGCTSLQEITIPNSVTSIDKFAFYGCTSLQKIKISKTTNIGNDVFSECPKTLIIERY
jgi:hypothetical protein